MIKKIKKNDIVVCCLIIGVVCGLIYQGFYSITSLQDIAHQPINFG